MRALRTLLAFAAATVGLLPLAAIVVIGLPFFGIAALTRLFHRAIARPLHGAPEWPELVAYEPVVGWKPRPNLSTTARGIRPFRVTTDADGWRGRGTLEDAEIVVFGDSFAFGHGADDGEMFSDHAGVRVKTIGVNGYSVVHSLLWTERLARRLEGRTVVWLIYYGNDLYENLVPNLDRYRMPFVRQRGPGVWEIVSAHVNPAAWHASGPRAYDERLAEICSPTFLSQRVFSACEWLIGRGDALCREHDARFLVMGAPDAYQIRPYGLRWLAERAPDPAAFDERRPDRELARACERAGVPFLGLMDHLGPEHFEPDDGHWNRSGHARVGRLLGDQHRRSVGSHRPELQEI